MLDSYRRAGRKTFLLTNSLWDYTQVSDNSVVLYAYMCSSMCVLIQVYLHNIQPCPTQINILTNYSHYTHINTQCVYSFILLIMNIHKLHYTI